MENLDPSSPPNQGWENGAFLPFARLHPWFGGDAGLLIHFILSKIVDLNQTENIKGTIKIEIEKIYDLYFQSGTPIS